MKKFVLLLIASVIVTFAIAQERTVSVTMPVNNTYYKYTGTASDVLIPTTCDTIDFVIAYQGAGYVTKVSVKSRYDMRTTADTTVICSVFGKEFSDDGTYVQIIGVATSSAVTSNNTVQVLSSDPYQTTASYVSTTDTSVAGTIKTITAAAQTTTPFDKSYRYYRVRYILSGDDAVGTGVKLDEIEFKVYTD